MIEVGDYVTFTKHAPAVIHHGAGYVTEVSEHHALIDDAVHLQSAAGDSMTLHAKQYRLVEGPESDSPGLWDRFWGSVARVTSGG